MTATPVVSTLDRDLWLTERRRGIGGSDAAAVCGLSPWRSPFEVWLEKTGAPGVEDRETEAMRWGTLLEPVVRTETAERAQVEIVPVNQLLAHPNYSWQLASVDGDVPEHDAIFEGKTAGYWAGDEWADGQVPQQYVLQGQHYLAVTGRARVLYGVLIGGQRLEVRWVERDDQLIADLTAIEAEFWRGVEQQVPPPVDGSKAVTELLKQLYQVDPGTVLTVPDADLEQVRWHLACRAEAKAAAKLAAEETAEHENPLKVRLGGHEIAVDESGRQLYTWKQIQRSEIDVDALRTARPEIAEAFTRITSYRRFHVPKGAPK